MKPQRQLKKMNREKQALLRQAQKPFVIAVVSIVAVIILIVLLFYGKQLVGKAFYVADVGTAGIERPPGLIYESTAFTLTVQANIGTGETVSVAFELPLPDGITCTDVTLQSLLPWAEGADSTLLSSTRECNSVTNTIQFEYINLDDLEAMVTGEVDIATITFGNGLAAGDYSFNFNYVELSDPINDANLITAVISDAEINVLPPIEQPTMAVTACGDGTRTDEEECDDGNTNNGDGCSSTCQTEAGFTCTGTPSTCSPIAAPPEEAIPTVEIPAEETITPAETTGSEAVPTPSTESTPSTGGGGGYSCTKQWSCPTQWSSCNATLQQSRTCTDLNRCDQRKLTKLENRSCTPCLESWVCTPWSTCQNAQQTRNCVDEYGCGVTTQKPELQKSCSQTIVSGPAPVRVQAQLPTAPVRQPQVARPDISAPVQTGMRSGILIGILLGSIVIAGVLVLVALRQRKKRQAQEMESQLQRGQ